MQEVGMTFCRHSHAKAAFSRNDEVQSTGEPYGRPGLQDFRPSIIVPPHRDGNDSIGILPA